MEKNNILKQLFNLNTDLKSSLSSDELEYLSELKDELVELIAVEGEIGDVKIRECVLDDLLKKNYENLIKYLGLDFDPEICKELEERLSDDSFLKIEEVEKVGDFFTDYLQDDIINDLILSTRGFERKSDGAREIFIKRRASKIPVSSVIAIENIFKSLFNRISFLSQKEDDEQARLILLAFSQIFDILLEIPYDCCDTKKTIDILSMSALKLTNLIGLSKGFRTELLDTLKESYMAERKMRDSDGGVKND